MSSRWSWQDETQIGSAGFSYSVILVSRIFSSAVAVSPIRPSRGVGRGAAIRLGVRPPGGGAGRVSSTAAVTATAAVTGPATSHHRRPGDRPAGGAADCCPSATRCRSSTWWPSRPSSARAAVGRTSGRLARHRATTPGDAEVDHPRPRGRPGARPRGGARS
ncbi:hypothetical protein [Nonomuraea sp. JJY05]|uniref:hypothetical protein n=1 Tax=Nonomuraea sp. JJY05 TaxID=3350255 RepID=UPI00373F8C33